MQPQPCAILARWPPDLRLVKLRRVSRHTMAASTLRGFAAEPVIQRRTMLATRAGCMVGHQIEPGGKGPGGLPPIGPAWRAVSAKYQGRSGAAEKLTQTVRIGSNPCACHWKGKVSGLAMPPDAVAIQEADARQLLQWILPLEAGEKS